MRKYTAYKCRGKIETQKLICRNLTVGKKYNVTRYSIGGKKHRVWDDLTLDGKKLTQFVALCYYEYFSRKIREIKGSLGVKNGEHDHDLKVNLDKEKALKNWLDSTSIQEIFDWFDAVEKVDVTTPYAKQVWTTEVIERDKLFLEKLGVDLQNF